MVKFPANRQALYYAFDETATLSPWSITVNTPSSLSTAANAADLIIISDSAPTFMTAAGVWATYRRNQGFTVKVIDVADIFDEFNYGTSSAVSLKSFLNYAYTNWQTPPKYVLLLGDASYDPRNYEGYGAWNLIPTKYASGIYAEDPSDEALADFNCDGLAEMAIGRIPAHYAGDITTAYNKVVLFETPQLQSLDRGILFAYDQSNDYNFQGFSESFRNLFPASMPASFVSKGQSEANTTLINEMNNGRYLVNYSGHGATGIWSSSTFFSVNHVVQLSNTSRPSIYTMLTCLNGFFTRPNADSLAEVLMRWPNGGAVAAWSSTGETTPDYQNTMATRFFDQLNKGNIKRLGDLIRDAKTTVAGTDVAFSWSLLGDPMLKVRQ
ncbi:hypothetical protein BH10ACI2_BH10ACI2_08560 [soil metagenome]